MVHLLLLMILVQHIAAHVGVKGLTVGKHTTAYKVSIEEEVVTIEVTDVNNLGTEKF